MNAPLPGPLADNPSLDRWIAFPAPGKVAVNTGRVEIGQGVLTAMAQIAADELDVAMERIAIRSGDTEFTPNEGYTAGSQSMQSGGVAMRQACADVRALFLAQAAIIIGCPASELTIRDGSILRGGKPTGQDYWTLAGAVNLAVKATGSGARKPISEFKHIGESSARLDLPDKIFGKATFIHDMTLPGMVHAHVVRQPNRGASIDKIDEKAILRAAKGKVEFVRHGNFLAIVGEDETAVDLAGAAAVNDVTWHNVETPTALQAEATWLLAAALDRPRCSARRRASRKAASASRRPTRAAISRMPRSRRPAGSPNIATATSRSGRIARACSPCARRSPRHSASTPSTITVHHVQGSGCYGHNGADDAAADAAIIAMQMPGKPIRVRWRREEEFVYEPKTPAMVVKVQALLDDAGKPVDWTQEIWSPTHNQPARRRRRAARRGRPARSDAGAAAGRRAGSRTAAAPPATASRSTTFRPSASSII